jgi:hypothetical protein
LQVSRSTPYERTSCHSFGYYRVGFPKGSKQAILIMLFVGRVSSAVICVGQREYSTQVESGSKQAQLGKSLGLTTGYVNNERCYQHDEREVDEIERGSEDNEYASKTEQCYGPGFFGDRH